jgi:hypothetical protein
MVMDGQRQTRPVGLVGIDLRDPAELAAALDYFDAVDAIGTRRDVPTALRRATNYRNDQLTPFARDTRRDAIVERDTGRVLLPALAVPFFTLGAALTARVRTRQRASYEAAAVIFGVDFFTGAGNGGQAAFNLSSRAISDAVRSYTSAPYGLSRTLVKLQEARRDAVAALGAARVNLWWPRDWVQVLPGEHGMRRLERGDGAVASAAQRENCVTHAAVIPASTLTRQLELFADLEVCELVARDCSVSDGAIDLYFICFRGRPVTAGTARGDDDGVLGPLRHDLLHTDCSATMHVSVSLSPTSDQLALIKYCGIHNHHNRQEDRSLMAMYPTLREVAEQLYQNGSHGQQLVSSMQSWSCSLSMDRSTRLRGYLHEDGGSSTALSLRSGAHISSPLVKVVDARRGMKSRVAQGEVVAAADRAQAALSAATLAATGAPASSDDAFAADFAGTLTVLQELTVSLGPVISPGLRGVVRRIFNTLPSKATAPTGSGDDDGNSGADGRSGAGSSSAAAVEAETDDGSGGGTT